MRVLIPRAKIAIVCLSVNFLAVLAAERLESVLIGENYEIRQKKAWLFSEPLAEVLAGAQDIYPQHSGKPVLFQVRVNTERPDLIYYTFINAADRDNGRRNFPLHNKGNYVIRRVINDNAGLDQIKIFLTSDAESESAIRLQHDERNGGSLMSISLYDHVLYQDFSLPYSLEEIAVWPLAHLVAETREWVAWPLLLGQGFFDLEPQVLSLLNKLRPLLPVLQEAYDGAMDRDGHFVRIENGEDLNPVGLNCSGFVKWVVDGIYRQYRLLLAPDQRPLLTDIGRLKREQFEHRGQLNSWNQRLAEQRDPYFGLDWSRALAAEVASLERGYQVPFENSDVRNVPFFHYYEDVGYRVEDLQPLLYLLAMKNPGYMYLATVSGDYGDPPLRQYYHIALLLPYFNRQGDFKIHVLDTTEELSLTQFQGFYAQQYVHLNAIRLPHTYPDPPLPTPLADNGLRLRP